MSSHDLYQNTGVYMSIDLQRHQHYIWEGHIDDEGVDAALRKVVQHERSRPSHDLHIILTTGGGSMSAALAFYDTVKTILKTPRLVFHAAGEVSSAGLIILMAGDRRYAGPNIMFEFHDLRRRYERGVTATAADLMRDAHEMQEMQKKMQEILVRHCEGKMTAEVFSNFCSRNYRLDLREAVEYGLCKPED